MIIKLLFIFVSFVVLKIIYNLYYFLMIKRYFSKYEDYLKNPKDWYIREHRQEIVEILKKAGVKDSLLPYIKPVGYGHVSAATVSGFENLAATDNDIKQFAYASIREAKTVFKSRILNSFNPISWLEAIIYFPKVLLSYVGMDVDKIIVKIAQIIWYILIITSLIINIFFNDDFTGWVKNFL